jgi:hypothetical protein
MFLKTMLPTKEDIQNLNTVIYELLVNTCKTVPEILLGYRQFVGPEDPLYRIYKGYENLLIQTGFCSERTDWHHPRIPHGYRRLQLEMKACEMILENKSVDDYFLLKPAEASVKQNAARGGNRLETKVRKM